MARAPPPFRVALAAGLLLAVAGGCLNGPQPEDGDGTPPGDLCGGASQPDLGIAQDYSWGGDPPRFRMLNVTVCNPLHVPIFLKPGHEACQTSWTLGAWMGGAWQPAHRQTPRALPCGRMPVERLLPGATASQVVTWSGGAEVDGVVTPVAPASLRVGFAYGMDAGTWNASSVSLAVQPLAGCNGARPLALSVSVQAAPPGGMRINASACNAGTGPISLPAEGDGCPAWRVEEFVGGAWQAVVATRSCSGPGTLPNGGVANVTLALGGGGHLEALHRLVLAYSDGGTPATVAKRFRLDGSCDGPDPVALRLSRAADREGSALEATACNNTEFPLHHVVASEDPHCLDSWSLFGYIEGGWRHVDQRADPAAFYPGRCPMHPDAWMQPPTSLLAPAAVAAKNIPISGRVMVNGTTYELDPSADLAVYFRYGADAATWDDVQVEARVGPTGSLAP